MEDGGDKTITKIMVGDRTIKTMDGEEIKTQKKMTDGEEIKAQMMDGEEITINKKVASGEMPFKESIGC